MSDDTKQKLLDLIRSTPKAHRMSKAWWKELRRLIRQQEEENLNEK